MNEFGFDPQRALAGLRRLAADAPAQLAGGANRLVRDASGERLEQVMRSPARRPLLEGIFWQMPRQLDARRAAGVSTHVRWQITGGPDGATDTFDLLVEDGTARTTRRLIASAPRLTITMDGAELLRVASGNSDPMAAYFKGRITLTGDIMVAAQIAQIFRMPTGPPASGQPHDLEDEPPPGL
jgi:putative sterol carrier protein